MHRPLGVKWLGSIRRQLSFAPDLQSRLYDRFMIDVQRIERLLQILDYSSVASCCSVVKPLSMHIIMQASCK